VDNNPVTVRATGSGGTDQTLLYVVPEAPKITGISPPNPAPGDIMLISTSGLQVRNVTVYFSRQDGSRIGVLASHGDNQVGLLVPPDAVEGPIEIDAQPVNSAAVRTAPFQAAISPKLRLRPNQTEVAQGESTVIAVAYLFDTRQRPLTWTSTIGSVDATGQFTAPSSVSQTEYARISACLTDRNVCGWTAIAVQPFRVEPAQPMVAAGGTLSLRGVSNGVAIPMKWQALGANATVDANGVVHASAGPLDGGVARVKATNGAGSSRVIDVAVTGTVSGVSGIDRDLLNWANGIAFGPGYRQVAMIGNRAYVLCTDMPDTSYIPGYEATWLDTWDVTDPLNPQWVGSTGLPIPILGAYLVNLGDELLVTGGWTTTVGSAQRNPVA
jgi:hypothetical protein